jgi:hypothetical protein
MMQMPVVAPLFIQNQDFRSTLILVNGSNVSTYADVVLTGLDGSQIASQRVQFSPHSQRRLEGDTLLQSAVSSGTTGRITVMQSPELKGMSINSQLAITYLGPKQSNYIDEEVAMPTAESSPILRAVTDKGDGSPIVALTSLAETLQRIEVECLGENGHFSKVIELAASETLLTAACDERTRHGADFHTVLDTAAEGQRRTVGIALSSDGMPGSFAAFGLTLHKNQDEHFFSAINFSDPKMAMSSNAVFAGVPVGWATLLPEGKYIPRVALANFSKKDLHAVIKYSRMSGETPVVQDVTNAVVPAMRTKYISLEGLEGDPDLENSFLVTADGAPGDLIAKLMSSSDSKLQEVEIAAKTEADVYNGGSHPWSLEEGNDSTLLLFNHDKKPLYFNVNIGSGTLIWEKAFLLQPMETRNVSLRELIQTQVEDDKKMVLPKDLTSGQLLWFVHALNAGHGRLLQSNRGTAMARNFSCPNGVVIGDAYFYNPGFSPTSLVAGQTQNTPNVQTDAFFPTYPGACSGQWAANGGTGLMYQWTSWNINAVSISGSNTMTYASLYGAGAGTAEVDVLVTDSHGCPAGAGGHTAVRVPTYFFSPSEKQIGTPSACVQAGYTGYFIDVSYYVADASSSRVSQSGMAPGENLGDGKGWHDAYATPATTRSDGSFDGTPFGACYGTSVHYCEAGPPQSFRLTNNGDVLSITTNTTSRKCTDGIKLVIQGNPSTPTNQNKTYTLGNVQ